MGDNEIESFATFGQENRQIRLKESGKNVAKAGHVTIDLDSLQRNQTKEKKKLPLQEITQNHSKSVEIKPTVNVQSERKDKHARKSSRFIRQSLMNLSHFQREEPDRMKQATPPKKIKIVIKKKPKNVLIFFEQEKNTVDKVLKQLFKKMIDDHHLQTCSINLQYENLSFAELDFISLLFDQIEPQFLTHINYPTFKLKAMQKCPKQLQEFIISVKNARIVQQVID